MEKWLIRGGLPDEYVRRFGVSRLLGKILSSRMSPEDAADFLREGPPDSDPAPSSGNASARARRSA